MRGNANRGNTNEFEDFFGFALALAAFGSVAVTAASADPAIYDGITITEFKALVDQMGIVTVG